VKLALNVSFESLFLFDWDANDRLLVLLTNFLANDAFCDLSLFLLLLRVHHLRAIASSNWLALKKVSFFSSHYIISDEFIKKRHYLRTRKPEKRSP
jgi:hypothetical protein